MLVGGYLVLHRPNQALIAGTSARFHCTACWQPFTDAVSGPEGCCAVIVCSPQFHSNDSFWIRSEAPFHFVGSEPTSFVTLALRVALLSSPELAKAQFEHQTKEGHCLKLLLRADNDFYSQIPHLRANGLEITPAALKAVPACQPPPTAGILARATDQLVPAEEPDAPVIRKTGLGSSAALTVSTIAAVSSLLGLLPSSSGEGFVDGASLTLADKATVMRCGQVSHGLAQGKVGSGFDVSAAVRGTQSYTRVSRSVMADAMNVVAAALKQDAAQDAIAAATGILCGARAPSEATSTDGTIAKVSGAATGVEKGACRGWMGAGWDLEVQPARLPRSLDLLLADVSGGSSTPSMVTKVEEWRENGGEAVWETVVEATTAAQSALAALAAAEGSSELSAEGNGVLPGVLAAMARVHASEWDARAGELAAAGGDTTAAAAAAAGYVRAAAAASEALKRWRVSMRAMGEAADVPIEPDTQTALIDATEAIPGVLAAAVPGGEYCLCCTVPTVHW